MSDIYTQMVQYAAEGLICLKADGSVAVWNRTAEALLGLAADRAVGRTLTLQEWNLVNEDGSACRPDQHPAAITLAGGKPITSQKMGIKKEDGSLIWVSISTTPLFETDNETVSEVIISLRNAAEPLGRDQASGWAEDIFNLIPAGLFIYCYQPPDRLILVQSNPESAKLTGINLADRVGKSFETIWPDGQAKDLKARLVEVMHTGRPYESENFSCRDDKLKEFYNIKAFRLPDNHLAVSFENITAKKEAEDALAQSRERFRLLFENSFDVIYMGDQVFRPTYFSPSVERMTGYTPKELMKLPLEGLVSPRSLGQAKEYARQRYESEALGQNDNKSRGVLLEVIRRDGEPIWIELVTTPIRDEDSMFKGVVGVIRETTDRVRTEQVLQESETLFRELFDNMSNGVAIYEAVEDGRDFIIKNLNRAGLASGMKKKEETIGRSIMEVFPGVEEMGLLEVLKRVWRTGVPEHQPSSIYHDDLLILWVENYVFKLPSGEIVAVYDNTTKRNQAEEALRDSEEKFRSITEQMVETVYVTDRQGLITYMSPVAENIFGYRAEEMLKRHFSEFLDPGSLDRGLLSFRDSLGKGLSTDHLGLSMKRKDGTAFFAELTGKPYRRQGKVLGSIGVIRDVTETKRAQEALRLSEEKFAKAFRRSPVWVVLSSLKDGRYLDVNDFFLESTGFAKEEILGKTSVELNTWADPETRDKIIDLIRDKGSVHNMEVGRLNRRGERLDMLFSGEVITLGEEELLLSVSLDITVRKRTEEALRDSEERFSLFAQQIPGLVYIKDHQGRYLYMNDKTYQFFGLSLEEILGRAPHEIFSREKAERYAETDRQLLKSGGPLTLTEVIEEPDGRRRTMTNHKFLIQRSGRPPLIAGFYLDATDQLLAEDALRKSEKKMRSIFRAAPVGISLAVNRVIQEVNEEFCRMVGYSKEELIGKNARMIYPSDRDFDYAGEEMLRQIGERGLGTVETVFRRKDGRIINVLIRGTPLDRNDPSTGLTFSLLDITDRKKARQDLKEAHQRLLTILGGIDSHIYVADMETHEILFMNQNMQDAFGADLTGRTCYQSIRREAGPCSYCTNPKLVDAQGRPTKMEIWEDQNPVTGRWYINYDRAIKWVDGRIVRLQIATDSTELKQAQQEKDNLESQLRQAQKMEALGTLAGGIAHDFNNILAAIIGYSELALDDAEEGRVQPDQIKEIIRAGQRAKDLVTQILTFSRKLKPELKPVDLNKVVLQTEKMLERTIPRMIKIERRLEPELWLTSADPSQLSQVLLNLGTNAADSMPEGGRLVIETGNVTLGEDYCGQHAGANPGDYILLTVSDTGHGMDRATQEHIFDPFFTQKEVGKGTGLGLATVYGVVKSHGGYTMCYSEVGQGTTFKVYLPAIRSASTEQRVEPLDTKIPGGNETILLVDDEEALLDLGQQLLSRQGYKTLSAATGEEALELYRRRPEDVDLVILDVSMPGMGGHKCLKELLKINPRAKVIIASGYSLNGQLTDIMASGAAGFVAKPFTRAALLRKVREVLDV